MKGFIELNLIDHSNDITEFTPIAIAVSSIKMIKKAGEVCNIYLKCHQKYKSTYLTVVEPYEDVIKLMEKALE